MAGQIHGPDLRPLLSDDLMIDVEAFEHCNKCRHVVAAIGIVWIDPGHGRELALPILDRKQRGHDRLALVIGAAEQVSRIGKLLVDAVLGRAVPVDGEGSGFLHHRPEREAGAGRDDALHAVYLLLLHQLAEALDRVLGRRFLLDHELDLAAGNAAAGVEALDCPLGGSNAVLSWRRGDARTRRENADAHRLVLRDCRCKHLCRRGQRADRRRGLEQASP